MGSVRFGIVLILVTGLWAADAAAQTGQVTLKGQVVCSDCWFEEEDRKANPYGTEADLKCAVRCSKARIPQALAVMGETEATLYLLENGKFKKQGKDWLEYVGKQVEITGSAREKGDKRYLKVDSLRVISEESGERKEAVSEAAVSEPPAPPSAQAPEITLRDMEGATRSLSDYRGQVVVVNFWATWCVPCREEMPVLVSVQKQYAARGVQVFGLSADEENTRKRIPAFIKEAQINFPIWVGATTDHMQLLGLGYNLPATAIIDRDGRIAARIIGKVEKGELEERVEWLLSDRSTPAPAPLIDKTARHEGHEHGEEGHTHGEGVTASTVPN